MAIPIETSNRSKTVIRPTIPKATPKATPKVSVSVASPPASDLSSAVAKFVSAPIPKTRPAPQAPASTTQLMQRLDQSRPVTFSAANPAAPKSNSSNPTWGAAAGIAGAKAVASLAGAAKLEAPRKADAVPQSSPPDQILRDYAKDFGEDLSDGLKDEVLDRVRDSLVDRAESCVGPSAHEDLKKFDKAKLGADLTKSSLDVIEAQNDLNKATTPAEKLRAENKLAQARQAGAEAVGEYLENRAEGERLKEQCDPVSDPRTPVLPNVPPVLKPQPLPEFEPAPKPGLTPAPGLTPNPVLTPLPGGFTLAV